MTIPLRILIVEDSEDDTVVLLRELQRADYVPTHKRVDISRGMESALDREPWDVVISDYNLPGFSAPAALRLLQRRQPEIPFIIVSGVIGDREAVAAMKAGAQDYIFIQKPYAPTALSQKVREVLDQ